MGGTHVQLVQRDRADGRAVHGEGVAGVAREVRERVCCHRRARVHLRTILLTAVILQTKAKKKKKLAVDRTTNFGKSGRQKQLTAFSSSNNPPKAFKIWSY